TGTLYAGTINTSTEALSENNGTTYYDWLLNFNSNEGPTDTFWVQGQTTYPGVPTDGNDVVFGDLGNDWIVGGTGRDQLFGAWGPCNASGLAAFSRVAPPACRSTSTSCPPATAPTRCSPRSTEVTRPATASRSASSASWSQGTPPTATSRAIRATRRRATRT